MALTPAARGLALRIGDVDHPAGEKIHLRATPRMGGLAVYLAFGAATLVVLPLTKPVVGILAGGLVAVLVGVIDELFDLPPLVHLGGQMGAALLAVVAGLSIIRTVSLPTAGLTSPGLALPAALGFALTIFWLVGMMNTVNFLDGLDGLATGVVAIAAILLAVWASNPSRFALAPSVHHEELILPLVLVGALVGFLPFNWHLARIFLGDSGSMFLGLALGALSIIGPIKLATALLILIIPVLDVAWAIIRRQLRRRSFMSGDKQHVYHRMLELGLSHTSAVLLLYFLCIALGALDLFLTKLAKLIAFVLVALVLGTTFVILEVRTSKRAADQEHRVTAPLTGTKAEPR